MRKVLVFVLPIGVGLLALFVGRYPKAGQVLGFISGGFDGRAGEVFLVLRVPRVLMGLAVGAALGAGGAVYQGILRNPLVSPFILGASSGAAFGAALGFLFAPALVEPAAFGVGLFAVIAALFLGRAAASGPLGLILAGVAISALFSALLALLQYLADPHRLSSLVGWLLGSVGRAGWRATAVVGLASLAAVVLCSLAAWRINVLSLPEEEVRSLGVAAGRERALLLSIATLPVCLAVCWCGIIGWVGLLVPHAVRFLGGSDNRWVVVGSASVGAAFLCLADSATRIMPEEIPVGVLAALVGAPLFGLLLVRRGGARGAFA